MDSCPVRAEQVLEGHGRPLRAMLSRPSDWAKYEIALDVALHFGPEDHSCAEKLNKNNDQVGRETLQLFKSGFGATQDLEDPGNSLARHVFLVSPRHLSRKHTAKTASGDRAKLVMLVDGARHGQDRRRGAGAPLSDPS